MKENHSIRLLVLAVALFSAQLASAYCMYFMGDSPQKGPLVVLVFKNKLLYESTKFAQKVKDRAIELGKEQFAEQLGKNPNISAAIPVASNAIDTFLKRLTRSARHSLRPGANACYDWKSIVGKKSAKNEENRKKRYYFVALNEKNKTFIGAGHFEIGGWVQFKIMQDGTGAFKIFNTDKSLRYQTDNYEGPIQAEIPTPVQAGMPLKPETNMPVETAG